MDQGDEPDELGAEGGGTLAPKPIRVEFRTWSIVRALGIVCGAVGLLLIARAANTVLLWFSVATVLAALFYTPLVLLRRRLPNWLAITVLVVVVLGVTGAISYRGFGELTEQVAGARTNAVAEARELERSESLGAVATEFGLAAKVESAFSSIPLVPSGDDDLGETVGTAASGGGALFAVVTLALMMLLFGQRFLHAGLDQVEQPMRRRRLRRLITTAYDRCSRAAWMVAGRAAVVGVLAALLAAAFGASSPTVIGLWFAALSILPFLGIVLATLPLAGLVAMQRPAAALAMLVLAVIVQALDAMAVQSRIERASVRVGPLPTLLAVLLGFQVAGAGGVLVGLALTIFALAVIDLLLVDHDDLPSALRDLADHQDHPSPTTPEAIEIAALSGVRVERAGDLTRVTDLGVRTPLIVGATLVAAAIVYGVVVTGPVVALAGLAILFAFAVDPVVARIEGWLHLSRGFAVAVVCGLAAIAGFAGVVAFGPSSVEQARSFQDDLPRVVDEMTTLPAIGPVLASNDAPQQVRAWAADLPKRMGHDPSTITEAATTVVSALVAGLLVFLIMISALIDGPRLVGILERVPSPHRLSVLRRAGRLLGQSVGRYFSGSLVMAGLQATQVLITGLALGVPLSPALALWAGVWNLVPQAGGAIGGSLFVLVAFTQGAATGCIAAAAFMVYLLFANNVLLPIIIGKAVDISPVTTMVATIGGFAVGGIIGTMVAVPILAAGKAIYAEVRPDHFERYRRSTHRPRPRPRLRRGSRTSPPAATDLPSTPVAHTS